MSYALCYVSTASEFLSQAEILSILRDTENWNMNNQINGILIHSGGNFFQVLEGKKETVLQLYDKICQDSRHHHMIKIFSKTIKKPCFNNYSREFYTISDIHSKHLYLKRFLRYKKRVHPEYYKSISYLIDRFVYGNKKLVV